MVIENLTGGPVEGWYWKLNGDSNGSFHHACQKQKPEWLGPLWTWSFVLFRYKQTIITSHFVVQVTISFSFLRNNDMLLCMASFLSMGRLQYSSISSHIHVNYPGMLKNMRTSMTPVVLIAVAIPPIDDFRIFWRCLAQDSPDDPLRHDSPERWKLP